MAYKHFHDTQLFNLSILLNNLLRRVFRLWEERFNMLKFINNIKIRTKLFIFVASILALMIVIAVVFLYNAYLNEQNNFQLIEQTTRSNYDMKLQTDVFILCGG